MNLHFSPDGSLMGSYPRINGIPLRPVQVEATPSRARFQLAQGLVDLELEENALHCRTRGLPAPIRVEPLAGFRPETPPTRWWRISHGMGGGSTLGPLSDAVSHGLALFDLEGKTLGVHACDQSVHALQVKVAQGEINAGYVTEGLSGDLDLPAIHLSESTGTPWDHARRMAAEVAQAMGATFRESPGGIWCSWYRHYHHFSHKLLRETLEGLRSIPDRGCVEVVQIDAGYCAALGDWLSPNDLWPEGLQGPLREIQEAGFTPGLWIGPFMVGNRSSIFTDHPDWLLRKRDGSLVTSFKGYGEHRLWRYADEEYHTLDTSHPEAFEFLRNTIRTLVSWGVRYIKADFLFWGYHEDQNVLRAVPGLTATQHVRRVVAMIREELGEDGQFLGCIAPFIPCLGVVDAMRIAGDVGPSWDSQFNPRNFLAESIGCAPLEGLWWRNDSDAILVRDTHTGFTDHEVHDLALWQAGLGSNISTSDSLWDIPPARLDLWRRACASGSILPSAWGGEGIPPQPNPKAPQA